MLSINFPKHKSQKVSASSRYKKNSLPNNIFEILRNKFIVCALTAFSLNESAFYFRARVSVCSWFSTFVRT